MKGYKWDPGRFDFRYLPVTPSPPSAQIPTFHLKVGAQWSVEAITGPLVGVPGVRKKENIEHGGGGGWGECRGIKSVIKLFRKWTVSPHIFLNFSIELSLCFPPRIFQLFQEIL